jgi:hypothetical protein
MQRFLGAVGAVAGILVWWWSASRPYLIGAVLLGAVISFTLLAIFPINRKLLEPLLDVDSAEAIALLRRWQRLHAVRGGLSLLSFLALRLCCRWGMNAFSLRDEARPF